MSEVLRLTEALVSRRSLTPDDAGCQAMMMERLQSLGFAVEPMRFGQVDNFWARLGKAGPLLVFAGHTDVVPSGPLEQWKSDPFKPEIRDGLLYGRGTADMKGGLAAMLVAVERYLSSKPAMRGSIGFLITSDEEGPSVDGTAKVVQVLEKRAERIDWCVLGEPSCLEKFGDTLRNGRRGSLTGILKVEGIQGHVAYPERADNPVHRVAPALATLIRERWDDGNAFFPPTSFQISNFNSGTGAGNVIPGDATVRFNFRYGSAVTKEELKARVHAVLDEARLKYSIDWRPMGDPFLTQPGDLSQAMQEAVQKATGLRPKLDTGGGTSDGRFIAPMGAQVVEFGPRNASIHKIDECVAVKELEQLVDIYYDVLKRLLG